MELQKIERWSLIGHLVSMAFGLAGLLIVLPHAELILQLPPIGQSVFQLSMANGGVMYILFGTIAVAIYAYRMLGLNQLLCFMVPAVVLSLGSELLGTSTGLPFGDYSYLNGLGYKIAGLVPFTIPLSWFYLGFSCYIIARAGFDNTQLPNWLRHAGAVFCGALLLTAWDFVLDPAMSQTVVPFWEWKTPGPFFGMPYMNFAGWMETGALFMSVTALLWPKETIKLDRTQLQLPMAIYLGNFVFAAVLSMAGNIWIPMLLGIAVGIIPLFVLWFAARPATVNMSTTAELALVTEAEYISSGNS
jgi:putative membrane protein